jgi:hypothetical protein
MRLRNALRLSLAILTALAGGAATPLGEAERDCALPSRFVCYPGQFSGFRAQPVTFIDQFSKVATIVIRIPGTVCAPAPGSSANYLTCYRATVRKTKFVARSVKAVDEFTKVPVAATLSRLLTVCAPTSRVDTGGGTPKRLDFFTCYSTKWSRTTTHTDVAVSDDFGSSHDDVQTGNIFCAPAARSGLRQFDRTRFLNCYTVKSSTKGTTVVVKNALGYLKAALGPRQQLCTTAHLAP